MWRIIQTDQEIDLEKTFFCGQIFSFQKTGENEFSGLVDNHLFTFKQMGDRVFFKVHNHTDNVDYNHIVSRFFTLDLDYKHILNNWNKKIAVSDHVYNSAFLKSLIFKENGLRLLRCDLRETIFSFICSANNNIKRITRMVHVLFSLGEYITSINDCRFYHFPDPEKLCDKISFLRANKFGYRAEYITKTANLMKTLNYEQLKNLSYVESFSILNKYSGISFKVADCVCLLGLHYFDVVPIDRHMFKLSRCLFAVPYDKLNKSTYIKIKNKFQSFFGSYSGLAQLFLFNMSINNLSQI